MLYKIVNQFKKEDNQENWLKYISFSGLSQITDFCSLDSTLNGSVFTPETEDDWRNCVQEDYKLDMITSIVYARKISNQHSGSRILGLIIDPKEFDGRYVGQLLGYDILDGFYSNSLLTNCGGFPEIFENNTINQFGLVDDIQKAYAIKNKLRDIYKQDPHARECEVIAVFNESEINAF